MIQIHVQYLCCPLDFQKNPCDTSRESRTDQFPPPGGLVRESCSTRGVAQYIFIYFYFHTKYGPHFGAHRQHKLKLIWDMGFT